MKIKVRSDAQNFTLLLPTRLIFSKTILKFGLRVGKKYSDQVPDIPPEAVNALCNEIRRIKKTHGSWELVDVQSGDGEHVQIIL